MKTAIVTGATGFIGKALSIELLNKGYVVYGIGRSAEKFNELNKVENFHAVILDFEQYDNLIKLLSGVEIDLFFHTAYRGVNGAKKSDYLVQLQNLDVSCKTVSIAAELGCKRYVYVGSVDEFEVARRPDEIFMEPTHSRIYASIKYSSEIIGKTIAYEKHIEYVAPLLCLTYGEGNKTNVLPHMIIRNSIDGKSINLIKGDNYFDMIHISEAVAGIIAVAEKGKSYESYFIGHEELRTFKRLVEEISTFINSQQPLNFGLYPDPSFSLDYESIDREKLKRDTGYYCENNFKESILNTYKWIKSDEYGDIL